MAKEKTEITKAELKVKMFKLQKEISQSGLDDICKNFAMLGDLNESARGFMAKGIHAVYKIFEQEKEQTLFVEYDGDPVLHAKNPYHEDAIVVSGWGIEIYQPNKDWQEIVTKGLTKITPETLKESNKNFGFNLRTNQVYARLWNQGEEVRDKLVESNLINKCIDFALLDPNKKTQQGSDYTIVQANFESERVRVEYKDGRYQSFKLDVFQDQTKVLDASNTARDYSIKLADNKYLHTYIPGKWEERIIQGPEIASESDLERASKLGIIFE